MNRYILHIAWFDNRLINRNLTSVQNALKYSTSPTEIVLVLNEQTLIDTPDTGSPSDMWKEFMDHPLIPKCEIIRITNSDPFTGVSRVRRDFRSKDGLTYWGESDCLVPLEYFYLAEKFYSTYKQLPYVMSFAARKMWPGWEIIEHPLVKDRLLEKFDRSNPEEAVLRCEGPLEPEWLYDFNSKQGNPEIVKLERPRIEGSMTILSNGMPEPLLCPTQDFIGEDYCLELSMGFYGIPQFHVKNILKGHDTASPLKMTNVSIRKKSETGFSNIGKERKEKEVKEMYQFIQSLYDSRH